jgi:heme/copper-type cytochrome/quinol oxidase subunit 1
MTTIDAHVGASTQAKGTSPSFVAAIGNWVTSSDHKKIGKIFIGCSLLFALSPSILGALFGFERMTPGSTGIVGAGAVTQLVSLYHFDLVFGVLAPLFIGLAIAVVPMQVGARSIAFPRLAQYSLWAWLFGSALVAASLIANGGPGGGSSNMVDLYFLGLGLTIVGLVAASISIATTVLTARAPGMALDYVPPFTWAALVGSIATIVSLPVALSTIIYVYVDHTHAALALGGKGIETTLSWAFSQPQTFVFVVMALGVLAEIAPITARVRQPLRPIVLTGIALITTAVLGAVTQSQHLVDFSGSNAVKTFVPFIVFNGLPLLGVLITVAVAMLSLKEGKPAVNGQFALAVLGALMILVGVAGNFLQNVKATNLSGTVFAEAVTVYLVYGGLLAAMGAIAHWAPKLWGRTLPTQKLLGLAALGVIGTIAAAFPLYIAGFSDQPANALGSFTYDGPIALWNALSGIGHALVALVVIAFIGLLIDAVRNGAQATDDPWNGHTLEWAIPSPAPVNNFAELAQVGSPEPVLDAKPASQEASA